MSLEDKGFILKKVEYSDFDFILTIFTLNNGKTSFLIKNARKSKRRFAGKLEPFSLITLNYKGSLDSIKLLNSIQANNDYNNTNLDKKTVILSSMITEYIDIFEISDVPNNKTFQILDNFFLKLNKTNIIKTLDLVLEFQIKYLTIHGLKPTNKELEKIHGGKIELEKNKVIKNAVSRINLIKIIAKFSQFHAGKEFNSIQYLDLL